MRKRLWMAATTLSVLALLGTVAGAANSSVDSTSVDGPGSSANVTSRSGVATTMATQAHEQATQANLNEQTDNDNDETTDNQRPFISPSTQAAPAGTSTTQPGWGCGDVNHEHTGPPGRPDATPPPGCDKTAGSSGQNSSHGNGANPGVGQSQSQNSSNKGKGKP